MKAKFINYLSSSIEACIKNSRTFRALFSMKLTIKRFSEQLLVKYGSLLYLFSLAPSFFEGIKMYSKNTQQVDVHTQQTERCWLLKIRVFHMYCALSRGTKEELEWKNQEPLPLPALPPVIIKKITGWDPLECSSSTPLYFIHPISCSVGPAPLCLIFLL